MKGMPLIFSATGEALFFQGTGHAGKLYVSTFGFDREDTAWPVHLTFIPFLDLCLQNTRPQDPTPSNFEPGETATLSLPANSTVREAVLRDGENELQRVIVEEGRAQLRMPGQPGLFTLSYDDADEPAKIFSVNPPPKESRLPALDDPAILETWHFDSGVTSENAAEPAGRVPLSLSAILRQRVWWLLLIAGVVALLLETFWTALRKEGIP
jgi:hypothetical protein